MHTSLDGEGQQSGTSLLLSRTAKVVYMFSAWIIVSTVSMVTLAIGAFQAVTPGESLLALGFFINVAMFLFFLLGFNMFRIGSVYRIPPSKRARILFIGSLLTFCVVSILLTIIVVAYPAFFSVFGSFLQSLGRPLSDVISLATMYAGLLWLVCGGLAIMRIFDVISGIPGLVQEIRSNHQILFSKSRRGNIIMTAAYMLMWGPYILSLLFYQEAAWSIQAAILFMASLGVTALGTMSLVILARTLKRLGVRRYRYRFIGAKASGRLRGEELERP